MKMNNPLFELLNIVADFIYRWSMYRNHRYKVSLRSLNLTPGRVFVGLMVCLCVVDSHARKFDTPINLSEVERDVHYSWYNVTALNRVRAILTETPYVANVSFAVHPNTPTPRAAYTSVTLQALHEHMSPLFSHIPLKDFMIDCMYWNIE